MESQEQAMQARAPCIICSMYRKNESPILSKVEAGTIAPLIDALERYDRPTLQHETLGILNNIAFGAREHTVLVVNSGVIHKVVDLIAYEGYLADLAILTLGSFALQGPEARYAVLEHGAVTAMLPYIRTDTPIRRLRTCVRALSNFCSHNDETSFGLVSPALPFIHNILDIENEESLDDDKAVPFIVRDILVDACTTLTNIMQGPDEYIEAVQAVPGLTARLVALLGHEASAVRGAALSAVGNMLGGTGIQVDRCLDANCLDHIVSLLQSSNTSLVEEAARATSNIFAETHSQIQRALEKDILTPLQNLLEDGKSECQKQAVYAVTYLCYNGSAAQHEQLVSRGVLPPYCALLTTPDLAGEVLDGLNELVQAAERDGNVKPLCYMLDELDVLEHMHQLKEHITDEDQINKLVTMSKTLRKHAREERSIVHEETFFTIQKIVKDLESQHQETKKRASLAAYHILIEKHPPINALLEAGIIGVLVEGIHCPVLQDIASWALAYISNTPKHRMAVVDGGAMPKLISYLVHGGKVAKLAAGALGNIALNGPETRDAVLAYMMQSETALTELRIYIRNFKNMCNQIHQESMKRYKRITLRALPFVKELLTIFEDQQILEDSCRACSSLMLDPDNNTIEGVQAVPGLTARFVALMGHEDTNVQKEALRAVANMLSRTDTQADRCLSAGCVDHVVSLLQSSTPAVVELAALAARNILSHTESHIQHALDKDILTPLRKVLANGDDKCQYHAVYAIANLCIKGSAAQRACVVSSGVLGPFCAFLALPDLEVARKVLAILYMLIQDAKGNNTVKPLSEELIKVGVFDQIQHFQEQEVDNVIRTTAVALSGYLRQQAREEHVAFEDGYVFTIGKIVNELKSQNLPTKLCAARAARIMLREPKCPRTAMVQAGVVALLVAALDRRECAELQCVAAGALLLITAGTPKHRSAVINSGAIPKLVALLALGTDGSEPAALALALLSRRSPDIRDLVLSHGAVRAMLPHLHPGAPLDLLRFCVSAYADFCTSMVSKSIFELVKPALPYISELLYMEDDRILKAVCSAFSHLTHTLEELDPAPEVAARLVVLMGHKAETVKRAALGAVGNMLTGSSAQVERYIDAGCLDHLVSFLQCDDASLAAEAARATANMLRHKHSCIERALEKDFLTPLLNILDYAEPNSFLQYHAVGAFANLTSGKREHAMPVVEGGGIPKLIALLYHGEAVAEAAALALGNLAGGNTEVTYLMLSHGAVEAILPYMRPCTPLDLLIRCLETYKNICGEIVSLSMLEFVSPGLPYLSALLDYKNQDVQRSACAALSNLMLGPDDNKEAVQAVPGLTARLVALLGHEASEVREAALGAVINMCRGTEAQIDRCLDAGCLGYLVSFLRCREPDVVEKAVRAACNILRYSYSIQRALKEDMLSPLLNIIAEEKPNSLLQYQAVGALNNLAASGTPELRVAVVNSGAVPMLVTLLSQEAPVAELAALALGYIAGVGSETRDLVRAHGAVPAILQNMKPDRPLRLWSSCVMAYENFCRDDEDDIRNILELISPKLPLIFELEDTADELDKRSCGALIVLMRMNGGVEVVQAVPGLAARLVALLRHEAVRVKRAAIVAVMLMLSGTQAQDDRCFTANCVDCITSFLECRDSFLMDEAIEATRAKLGETHLLLQSTLQQDVLTPLMRVLACDPKDQMRIVKGIGNLCRRASGSQRARLVSRGVLQPCCALLAAPGQAGAVLEALGDLLQVAKDDGDLKALCLKLVEMGVLDQIKLLREHEDEEVNEKARRLLHAYFSGESRPRQPTTAFSYLLVISLKLFYEVWNQL